MKILANKNIRDLFCALTLVLCALLLMTEGVMWFACRSFSPWLPLLFLLAGGAVWLLCLGYFKRQNRTMEQAVSQITSYLGGDRSDRSARIECDSEGELYRLFHSVNSMAAVLNAHADNELREKEFLPIFRQSLLISLSSIGTASPSDRALRGGLNLSAPSFPLCR